MLQKILKFLKFQKSFNHLKENSFPPMPADKLDNGLDTLAAVKRYITLKDSPYILKKGEQRHEYLLKNSESGAVIMRFRSALKEYIELSEF